MLISSKRSRSSIRFNGGFTLVELVVSIGILLLIVSIVIFKYSSFDSFILMRTLSYDIGLSVRQAQSYSLSALGYESDFRVPYGVSFTPSSTSYTFFRGSGTPPHFTGDYVNIYKLGRSFEISDVCVVAGGAENCSISQLDISFQRPEYTAIFYVPGYAGDLDDIESGIVKIVSTKNPDVLGTIEVTTTGQIEVNIE